MGHLSHIKIKHYKASLASLREQCRVPSPILCLPPPGFPPVPLLPPGFLLLFHYECIITLILSYYYSTIILMLFYYYLCSFQPLFLIHMFNLFFLLFVLFLFLIVYLLHPFFNGLVCPISFLPSYLYQMFSFVCCISALILFSFSIFCFLVANY